MRRTLAIVVVAAALGAVGMAAALAKSHPPRFADCISGETEAGRPSHGGQGNCALIPTAMPNGTGSGIQQPLAMAITADGRSLYTAQYTDSSVGEFRRSPKTGKLTYLGCISGSETVGPAGSGACTLIASHTPTGVGSGLGGLRGVAVSPNGKSVYAIASATFPPDDAIATFDRDKDTGKLKYVSCITGNTALGPVAGGGNGACQATPDATSDGNDSGLARPRDLVVSADGQSVYGVAADDADAFWLSRSGSGKLTWKGCLTGDSAASAGSGTGACKALPATGTGGLDSGLQSPEYAFISPDDRFVYISARGDSAIATFRRPGKGNKLTFKGCLTGSTAVGPAGGGGSGACHAIPAATPSGQASGLASPYAMAVGAHGHAFYAAAAGDDAVVTFNRSPKTGKISFRRCFSGNTAAGPPAGGGSGACKAAPDSTLGGAASGFSNLTGVAAQGRRVVALGSHDSAVSSFSASKKKGGLTYRGCLTSDPNTGPTGTGACKAMPRIGMYSGLTSATSLIFAPSRPDVYVAGAGNSAVVRLAP